MVGQGAGMIFWSSLKLCYTFYVVYNMCITQLVLSCAVREGKYETGRGGGRGGGRGFGRGRGGGGGGFPRDPISNENTNGVYGGYRAPEEGDTGKSSERRGGYGGPRGSFRGGRRGGFNNGDDAEGERPRRVFDRRSGTGHGLVVFGLFVI